MTDLLPAEVDEPIILTQKQREKFIALIRANPKASTRKALFEVGVGRQTTWQANPITKKPRSALCPLTKKDADRLIRADPDLFEDYQYARGVGPEEIKAEIRRRAIDGVEKPVFHNGQIVGFITEHSDRLLMMMAKAYLPEYRDGATVSLDGDGKVKSVQVGVPLSDVEKILRAAGAFRDGDSEDDESDEDEEVVDHDGGDGIDDAE